MKMLVRDWVAAGSASGSALLCADYEKPLRSLPPLERRRRRRTARQTRRSAALARTNVPAGLVAELVRMALTRAAGLTKSA